MREETKHSIILTAGTGITAVLAMLYSLYVGRTLGPAEFDDFAAAVSFIFIGTVAAGLINPTVARFTAEYRSKSEFGKVRMLAREITKRVALWGAIGILTALLVIIPLARFLKFDSPYPLLVAYSVLYLNLMMAIARGLLRGIQHFGQLGFNTTVEAASRLLIGIGLLKLAATAPMGLTAYAVALIITLFVSRLQVNRIWAGHEPQRIDGAAIRRFTGPVFLMSIATVCFQNLDMLFAKRYLSDVDAGIFGAAVTFARMIAVMVTPFSTLMLPLLTTLHEQGHATGRTFLRVCGYFLALVALPLAIFCIWPDQVMRAWGDSYTGGGSTLRLLVIARLLSYLSNLICLYFAAKKQFGFLVIYLPGLLIMCVAMMLHNDTSPELAGTVTAAQAIVLAMMLGYMWTRREKATRTHPGPGGDPTNSSPTSR